jgi:hypothetical protein
MYDSDEINSLKRALDQIIDLPMEEPTGSQDIYGQGISLSIDMDGFQWSNRNKQTND